MGNLLRLATLDDCRRLWHWANDSEVRRNAFETASISLEEHRCWLAGKLANAGCIIWIAEADGIPAAQVRYDRVENDIAEVDVSVASDMRGSGIGSWLIDNTWPMACEVLGVRRIRAVVFADNQRSQKAFLNAGFEYIGSRCIRQKECEIFSQACTGTDDGN